MSKENERDLFDVVLIVELQEENGGKIVPFISYRFPQVAIEGGCAVYTPGSGTVKDHIDSVTQFCFPDINQFPTEEMKSEIFSFVVTDGSGERRFGYCLRKLPPGSGLRFPTAYSILSYFPCYSLYTTIIDKVAYHYENSSMSTLTNFLKSMVIHRFPAPGQSFTVKLEESGVVKDFRFTRPDGADSQLEYVDVDPLLIQLNPTNILTIFFSLLFERRIIFCASKLSILSSCVQTAVAFLYPFNWQHIYIPVLPKTLLSFCCAPMPFVVGILATELPEVLTLPMDEVLIINIDNDSFIRTPGTNDLSQLPFNYIEPLIKVVKASGRVVQKYQKKIKEVRKLPKSEADFQENQLLYEVKKQKSELKETFLEFFVYLFGTLRSHIKDDKFNTQAFLSSQPHEIKDFMELIIASQMFEMFIQDRIHTKYTDDSFEKAVIHREKLNSEFTRFFGEAVDGSLYKPTAVKKQSKTKKSSVFDTFRRGIKTTLTTSGSVDAPISGPTLVQSTSERTGSLTHSSNTPISVPSDPKPPAPVPTTPSPQSPAPTSSNFSQAPVFTPPAKPIPLPPGRKHSADQTVNSNVNNNSNESILLRDKQKMAVRHFHSQAIPASKLSNSGPAHLPPLPPRKSKTEPQPTSPFDHSPNNNNMQNTLNNNPILPLSAPPPRGAMLMRGRVRQRPQSSRPNSLNPVLEEDEEDEEERQSEVTHFSTLRNIPVPTDRPLPSPRSPKPTTFSTLRSTEGSKNNFRPLPRPPPG